MSGGNPHVVVIYEHVLQEMSLILKMKNKTSKLELLIKMLLLRSEEGKRERAVFAFLVYNSKILHCALGYI